jgi:hypothetical protein
MRNLGRILKLTTASAALCFAAASAQAATIPVANANFSSPDLSNPSTPGLIVNPIGNFTYYATGWVSSGFAGTVALTPGSASWLGGAQPSAQFGYVNAGGSLSQTLAGYTVTAGTTYTFSADILSRNDYPTPAGAVLDLVANGSNVLISLSPGGLAANTWQTFTNSFTVTSGFPLVGETLGIYAVSDAQLDFTNVSLTTTPTTSAVPEASTWAMMVIGFAGLGYLANRRAKKPAQALA